MSTLLASYHCSVQAINKSAQIREAYMQGCTTADTVQKLLKTKGVQATDALVKQVLAKMEKKPKGWLSVNKAYWKANKELSNMVRDTDVFNFDEKKQIADNALFWATAFVIDVCFAALNELKKAKARYNETKSEYRQEQLRFYKKQLDESCKRASLCANLNGDFTIVLEKIKEIGELVVPKGEL